MSNQRKQSLYFPSEMLEEIRAEAARLDRSVSWMVQRAWRRARTKIRSMAGANDAMPQEQAHDEE